MELDGSINNLENSNELSEIKLAEIIKEYPNFGKIYTVEEGVNPTVYAVE